MTRYRNTILTLTIMFMLGCSLVVPIFSKKENIIISADSVIDAGSHIYYYPPISNNTFGNYAPVRQVNWTYFKQLFLDHTNIILQYRQNNSIVWLNGNQFLDIERTWYDDLGGWKINFTMNKPATNDVVDARFIFSCDIPVLNYIEREDQYTWFINYTVPDYPNETYQVYFNWSDLLQYNNLILSKGIQDNNFYFIIQRNDITKNAITIKLDPTFGNTGTESGWARIGTLRTTPFPNGNSYQTALKISATDTVDIDSITAYLKNDDNNEDLEVKCAIYDDSGIDIISNGESNADDIPDGETGDWYTFTFSTDPTLTNGNDYYLAIYGEKPSDGDGGSIYKGTHISYVTSGSSTTIVENKMASYPTWEDPWSGYISDTSSEMSIYCSYSSNTNPTALYLRGADSVHYAGKSYSFTTRHDDADGVGEIQYAYGSVGDANNDIQFRCDPNQGTSPTVTVTSGSGYIIGTPTASRSGSSYYEITWAYTIDWDWDHDDSAVIDYWAYTTDDNGANSGWDQENLNYNYENEIIFYDVDYTLNSADYSEDGNTALTENEKFRDTAQVTATGTVTYEGTTNVYPPITAVDIQMWANGVDLGNTYEDSTLSASGYFDIPTYTTPPGGDSDYDFKVEMEDIVSGGSQGSGGDADEDMNSYKDGYHPTSDIDTIADGQCPTTITGTASDTGAGVKNVTIYIKDEDSDIFWDGDSWEVGITYFLATGTTTWSWDASSVTYPDGANIKIYCYAYDNVNNQQTVFGDETFVSCSSASWKGLINDTSFSFGNDPTETGLINNIDFTFGNIPEETALISNIDFTFGNSPTETGLINNIDFTFGNIPEETALINNIDFTFGNIPEETGLISNIDFTFGNILSETPLTSNIDFSFGNDPTETGLINNIDFTFGNVLSETTLISNIDFTFGNSPTETGLISNIDFTFGNTLEETALINNIDFTFGNSPAETGLINNIDFSFGNITEIIPLITNIDFSFGNIPTETGLISNIDFTFGNSPTETGLINNIDFTFGNSPTETGLISNIDFTFGDIPEETALISNIDFTFGNTPTETGLISNIDFTFGNSPTETGLINNIDFSYGNISGEIPLIQNIDFTFGNIPEETGLISNIDFSFGNIPTETGLISNIDFTFGNSPTETGLINNIDFTFGNITNEIALINNIDFSYGNTPTETGLISNIDFTFGNISGEYTGLITNIDFSFGNESEHTIEDVWEIVNNINNSMIKEDDTIEIAFAEAIIIILLAISLLAIGVMVKKKSGGIFIALSGTLFIALLLTGEFTASFSGAILVLGIIVIILGFYKLFFQDTDKESE